ncbi:hypothetical protein GXB84_15815 [Stenotrophomonas acidaminiphila]|uniref:hypothetical protein n=1 Tax=Stenotrophomonas acidaminiphila TaxID=128780 RepID=UPI00137638F3|nr:hypothetical protein [Stenotrophomonas acidaminiphila]NCT88785.1 hypothetical protein [Stenotrophomonas acidaminiphila]
MNPKTEWLPKKERLGKLYAAIKASAPASDLQTAWELVDRELRKVEDEHTSLPYDRPSNYGLGERMYIPPLHLADIWSETAHWHIADLFSHTLMLSGTGDIAIFNKKTKEIELRRDGHNHS